MSVSEPAANRDTLGETVVGGLFDITALLPLLGTEQVEKHIASALDGGYVYAAAAPLSIFGSLGIASAGMSILVSTISLPKLSFSLKNWKKGISISHSSRLLGGRVLDNAGFEHIGTVAPLIDLEEPTASFSRPSRPRDPGQALQLQLHPDTISLSTGRRFKAEAAFLEVLDQQHIDDIERVSITYHVKSWNWALLRSTIVAVALSILPYIQLIIAAVLRLPRTRSLLTFPIMRGVGCGLGVICCQLLLQLRIMKLLQARLAFHKLDKLLIQTLKKNQEAGPSLKDDPVLRWDPTEPAEDCLWRLRNAVRAQNETSYLSQLPFYHSRNNKRGASRDIQSGIGYIAGAKSAEKGNEDTESFQFSEYEKHQIRSHPAWAAASSSARNSIEYVLIWTFLLLSVVATIAGYVGSFAFVKAAPQDSPRVLIWLGVDLALALIRINVWAANPGFDERTGIQIELELSRPNFPFLETEDEIIDDHPLASHYREEGKEDVVYTYSPVSQPSLPRFVGAVIKLIPEHAFLQKITSCVGPLERFRCPPTKALYFTMSTRGIRDWETRCDKESSTLSSTSSSIGEHPRFEQRSPLTLIITIFDLSTRVATVLIEDGIYEAEVVYNRRTKVMEARVMKSRIPQDQEQYADVFEYRESIMAKLYEPPPSPMVIPLQWSLLPKC